MRLEDVKAEGPKRHTIGYDFQFEAIAPALLEQVGRVNGWIMIDGEPGHGEFIIIALGSLPDFGFA